MPSGIEMAERVPVALRGDHSTARDDVFCLVKSELSSSGLSQPPLLVLPGTLKSRSKHFFDRANSTDLVEKPGLEADRLIEVRNLANAIRRDFPNMNRTVAWYQSFLDQHDAELGPYTQLTWLQSRSSEDPSFETFKLPERKPPAKPHCLQVVFHRSHD